MLSNITRGGLCQYVCVFCRVSHSFLTAARHQVMFLSLQGYITVTSPPTPIHHHHHHPPQHAARSHNLNFSGRRNHKCFYSLFYFTGFYVRACARGSRVNQACALLKNNCHLLCRGQNMKTPQRLFFYFFPFAERRRDRCACCGALSRTSSGRSKEFDRILSAIF